jgi:hypothetical protein
MVLKIRRGYDSISLINWDSGMGRLESHKETNILTVLMLQLDNLKMKVTV